MVREGPETGFLRDPLLRCEDLGKNPVSQDCGWVARNRVFARIFVTVRRFGKKPGFSRLGGWPETGFLPEYLLRCEDLGKNPVSQDWVGGQKPGFCQNICYGAKIWEKTRFLKIGWVARNRVFARSFVTTHKFGKKPGFSRLRMGCQKPGFCEILCYNPQIREKTRFLLILS